MNSSIAYRRYVLVLLMAILGCAFVDRVALGVLLQSIKMDLRLSDTQLGVVSGIAFALFYSLMGLPIARWADRGNRVAVISLTAALWSVAVALCGTSGSFVQLLSIRIGVGVGEAGALPTGMSLIADYFNRAERPRAVAVYMLGGPLAAIVGYWSAGVLNELYGWRVTFMFLGAPGLVLAALARITLRDPRHPEGTGRFAAQERAEATGSHAGQASVREVYETLGRNKTFRHLLMCTSVLFFFIYGSVQWQPAFFIRSFGVTSAEVGIWFALIYGVAGLVGTYFGGELASRYAADNESLQLRAVAIVIVTCAPISALAYLANGSRLAFIALAFLSFALYVINASLYSTIQTLTPQRMRAVAMALVMLFGNLIGMGLGPLATGVLSDVLHPIAQNESLRYALLSLSPGYLLAGWFSWRASRTVACDLASLPREDSEAVSVAASPDAIRL